MQHHAYLYEGPLSLFQQLVQDACQRFGFTREMNADVIAQQWEKFGIEESRALSQQASLKSTSGRSLFILSISSITSEAQQALLKLFEEPGQGMIFVVLTPPGLFISTLKSRFLPYDTDLSHTSDLKLATTFLQATQKERSTLVADMIDDEDNIKERVRSFLTALELVLKPKLAESAAIRSSMQDIEQFRSYVNDRAPSLKMILEHFAVTLPRL